MGMFNEIPTKELKKIAIAIGEAHTTADIIAVFSRKEVKTDETLFAKWRIVLSAFNGATEDKILNSIADFLHSMPEESDLVKTTREVLEKWEYEISNYDGHFIINKIDDSVHYLTNYKEVNRMIEHGAGFPERLKKIKEKHKLFIELMNLYCDNPRISLEEFDEHYKKLADELFIDLIDIGIDPFLPFGSPPFNGHKYPDLEDSRKKEIIKELNLITRKINSLIQRTRETREGKKPINFQKIRDYIENEELGGFDEKIKERKYIELYFNTKTGCLSTSTGNSTQKISGVALQLLRCFLSNKSKNYKCTRGEIITKLKGENQFSGAKRQLNMLLKNVAEIQEERDPNDNRRVIAYTLIGY